MMKKYAFVILLLIPLFQSCSLPQTFSLVLDVRYPFESKIDPSGRTVSLLCLESEDSVAKYISTAFADGIAQSLEKRYFSGKKEIDVYSRKASSFDISNKDSLSNLIVSIGCDLLIVLDEPIFEKTDADKFICTFNVSAFDSFDKSGTVRTLSRKSSLTSYQKDSLTLFSDAQLSGYHLASRIGGEYESGIYSFIYFDVYKEDWRLPLELADQMKWAEASEKWIELARTSTDPVKKSCASYNVALCLFLMEDNDLALKWLNISDKIYPVSLSRTLRSRIQRKSN